jgi:hypothetical protein
MAGYYLERLGLPQDKVITRIRFLTDRAASYRKQADRDDTVDPWRRTTWQGAAGTCMVQAVALSLLAEDYETDRLLDLAASDYVNAGLPFGYLLQSLRVPDGEIDGLLFSAPVVNWLRALDEAARKQETHDRKTGPDNELPAYLSVINQQLYVLMVLTSAGKVKKEYQKLLKGLIARLRSHPNLPHGPQGQPVAVHLDIFETVFYAGLNPDHRDPSPALNALRRLATHYAESIESARQNQYLWTNLWSPVAYLDLELMFAAKCVARALNHELDGIVEPSSVAAVPLLLGSQANRQRPIQFR